MAAGVTSDPAVVIIDRARSDSLPAMSNMIRPNASWVEIDSALSMGSSGGSGGEGESKSMGLAISLAGSGNGNGTLTVVEALI